MRSHTWNAARSSEYPWTRTTGLRCIGANIRTVRRPVGKEWNLYICDDEADAADDERTIREGSASRYRYVASRIQEARTCGDRLDCGLSRSTRSMAGSAGSSSGRCAGSVAA